MSARDDIYLCPAGGRLSYRYTNEEDGKTIETETSAAIWLRESSSATFDIQAVQYVSPK
jgi:hypothetical protein